MTDLNVIVGLGVTGLSCAKFLAKKKLPFAVIDTRLNPPLLNEFQALYPTAPLKLGQLDEALLNEATQIILSPGISKKNPAFLTALKRGVPIIGDVELFAKNKRIPTIAITGTNAKSTVTTLVGEMVKGAGYKTQVGGNLGEPVLNLLANEDAEVFVLELSSFQLETTYSLQPKVASVLNVTPDHMDRYQTFEEYVLVKKHVYTNCDIAIYNHDDPFTYCENNQTKSIYFTLNSPTENNFGLVEKNSKYYLAKGQQLLLAVDDLPIMGKQYQANALAALAIGHAFGLSMDSMVKTLLEFKGLPHRCQFVRRYKNIIWYNDSKGTNVGATLAAIEGLGTHKKNIILIAGGVGKNADFSPLLKPIKQYVKSVILLGEAASILESLFSSHVSVKNVSSMEEAVLLAKDIAEETDIVLLSPACASFDMFKNFEHRGEVFSQLVQNLKE